MSKAVEIIPRIASKIPNTAQLTKGTPFSDRSEIPLKCANKMGGKIKAVSEEATLPVSENTTATFGTNMAISIAPTKNARENSVGN
jgi:hypothetical protein